MKAVLALALVLSPGAVLAQSAGGYSYATASFQSSSMQAVGGVYDPNPNYTPFSRVSAANCQLSDTAQSERTARAIALRNEAAALVGRDGGTLSRWSEERVRRKAAAILAYGC